MIRTRSGTTILALVASLGILMASSQAQTAAAKQPVTKAPTTTQQNVPAEYQAGIAQLRVRQGLPGESRRQVGRVSCKGGRVDRPGLQSVWRKSGVNPSRNAIRQ
jgi:hypothetical protein